MTDIQSLQYVSSAELTRNFGAWQDRASRAPLVVTHHGRPRSVLLAADAYAKIAHASELEEYEVTINHAPLSERIDLGFVVVDSSFGLRDLNTLASVMLGRSRDKLVGASLFDLLPGLAEEPFHTQIRRVLRNDLPARFPLPGREGRGLQVHAFPWPTGLALTLQSASQEEEAEAELAGARALRAALGAHGHVGTAHVTVRASIARVDPHFARIVGIAPERLAGSRVTDLFAVASREAVTAAIEQVMSGGAAEAIDAKLLVDESRRTRRIALAAWREGFGIGGAVLLVPEA